MDKIEILIPVFNEGESILDSVETICKHLASIDNVDISLLIIDDGSLDDTYNEIIQSNTFNIPLRTISFTRNFGKILRL